MTPEDVALTKLEAKARYRMAFSQWLKLGGWDAAPEVRADLERIMDAMQPLICYGPGPEWQAFVATIPGFREAWGEGAFDHLRRALDASRERTP